MRAHTPRRTLPTPHLGAGGCRCLPLRVQGGPKRFLALVTRTCLKKGDLVSTLAGAFPFLCAASPMSEETAFSTWSLNSWACLSLWAVGCGLCSFNWVPGRREGVTAVQAGVLVVCQSHSHFLWVGHSPATQAVRSQTPGYETPRN